jgi:Type IV leader peptidase family
VAWVFGAPWQSQVALAAVFLALAISVVTDLRERAVYYAVWAPALAVALAMFLLLGSWPLLFEIAIGMIICAGPMLLSTLIKIGGKRAMAVGDVYLMLLTGCITGAADWRFAVTALVHVSIAGGVESLLWIVAARATGRPKPDYVPYALAIAAGTLSTFIAGIPVL